LRDEPHTLELVRFVLFDAKTLETYGTILQLFESGNAGDHQP
jgi:hypothetical protein